MSYIEDIQKRKNEIRNNILKGFGLEDTFEDSPDILKAAGTEDLFEKGKWKVGDEKVYQGVTYYVSDFNAKGTPKWRKKKGEEKPSGPSPSSGNAGGKKSVETTVTRKTNSGTDKSASSSSTAAIDAIKNSNVLRGSRGAEIASISVVTNKAGKKSASIIYQTYTGSYKICNVDIDKKGNVKKQNWQPTNAYSSADAAKKYVENDDKSISHDWKDEGSKQQSSSAKSDNSVTGKDFNIVGASAKNIADNVSDVLNGSVIGTKKIKIAGVNNVSINAHEVKIGNKTFLIHDGVFKNSYGAKGYSRSKGFTITDADGGNPITYKVNSTGTSFSNAFSTTAGDLAKTIKKRFLE